MIEVMVVLGLAALVISALGSFYAAGYRAFQTGDACTEIQDQARVGLDYLAEGLREARAIIKVNKNEVVFLDGCGQKAGFRFYSGVVYHDFYQTPGAQLPVASNPVAESLDTLEFSSPLPEAVRVVVVTAREGRSYRLETLVKQRSTGVSWKQEPGQ